MKKLYYIIAPILTAVMWSALVLLTTVTISLVTGTGEGGEELIDTTTLISIIVVVFTTFIWTPRGIGLAEETTKVINTTAIYNYRANYIIRNQLFAPLKDFCDFKNEEKKKEIIVAKLAKRELLYDDYLTYKDIYEKTSTLKDNEKEEFLARFDKKRTKLLQRLSSKKIRFKHLRPKHITQKHLSSASIVPFNKEHLSRAGALGFKVVWGVLVGVFMGAFIFTSKHGGMDTVIKILTWSASIIGSVFTSIRNGYNSVFILRCEYLVEKSDLTAEFFAFVKLPITEVEKDLVLRPTENK